MRSEPRALARRYALALLDVASAQAKGTPAALQGELAAFAGLLESNESLRATLLHPGLRAEARRRVLAALAEKAGASPLLRRLLDLLAAKDRVALLPALAEEYARGRDEREGRERAEAVSAVPLAGPQRDALVSALCKAAGRPVELRARVDPAVLGGVLVRLGGRTYDGTVRAQLAALRRRLASGS